MVAVKLSCAFGVSAAVGGDTLTEVGPAAMPVIVACVVPDFVGSSALVAVTETVLGEGAKLGAE